MILADLYDTKARGPVLDDVPFYRDCRAALAPAGILVVNVFGDMVVGQNSHLMFFSHPLRKLFNIRSVAGDVGGGIEEWQSGSSYGQVYYIKQRRPERSNKMLLTGVYCMIQPYICQRLF